MHAILSYASSRKSFGFFIPSRACRKQGNTALPLACASGSLECVDLLLEKGSLVNQTNDQRQTPLMRAAANGHADIVSKYEEFSFFYCTALQIILFVCRRMLLD